MFTWFPRQAYVQMDMITNISTPWRDYLLNSPNPHPKKILRITYSSGMKSIYTTGINLASFFLLLFLFQISIYIWNWFIWLPINRVGSFPLLEYLV